MSRLSSHLPRLGALVLAVALAGIAYSIYNGQSSDRNGGESSARGAGLTADFPGPKANPKPSSFDSAKPAHAVRRARGSATERASSTTPALALEPVAAPSPVSTQQGPAQSRPAPDRGGSVDRELRRLIDGPGGRTPTPAPRPPKGGQPVTPTPSPKQPGVGTPTPGGSTPVQNPDDGSGGSPVTDPVATDPVATPADPEAGLDDTPAGGLDQTDLGEPIDETAPGTGTAQPAG